MNQPLLPTRIVDATSQSLLEELCLEITPHPGSYLQGSLDTYLVLEKRHTYHLKNGRYRLHGIRVFVQVVTEPVTEQWIGDRRCIFNACSPLLRCAVNPLGPCEGCSDYLPKLDL